MEHGHAIPGCAWSDKAMPTKATPFEPRYGTDSWLEPNIVYLGSSEWVKVVDYDAQE